LKTVIKMTTSKNASLRSKTGRFLRDRDSGKDFISIAINETRFLDSPQIQRDLQSSSIDWDKLKHEVTTVYLILPADRFDTHASYLRLVLSSALRTLLRSPPGKTLPPVLFMLEEFAQLGYLPPIENAMGIADGVGVQLWPFLQDLNQIKALYQDRWQTFLGNAAALPPSRPAISLRPIIYPHAPATKSPSLNSRTSASTEPKRHVNAIRYASRRSNPSSRRQCPSVKCSALSSPSRTRS
jgi:Type IV secretory system Conjugative DNA transfer